MRTDIVGQAAAYLECSYRLLIVFAIIYDKKAPTEEFAEYILTRYRKGYFVPDWLEDFCIDLLAGRARVEIDLKSYEWKVVKIRRKDG